MTSVAKWTPRIPILPKNNIISSKYTNSKPFVPTYDKEPEDMFKIMSNTYAKKWHQEKTVFKKIIDQEKEENSVFLMRRYVIKGLNKKVRDLEALKAVPSRIKVGKKVPYAVRNLPKEKPATPLKGPSGKISKVIDPKVGLHVSIEEMESPKTCTVDDVDGRLSVKANVTPAEMKDLESKYNHVHVEQKGNKFVVHRIECERNHHHGCDCPDFDPDDAEPCQRKPCLD